MHQIELVLVLLAVAGPLQILARRLTVPFPSLLVLGGLALAFVPGLPRIDRDPELVFFIFVPPLLYWTSLTTSYRELRDLVGPVARLSTALVLITMAAVAMVVHTLIPDFTWASAFLLGAIVAPPDPIAPSAVLRPLGIPQEITTVLEGEGLFNDATAIVAYRIALSAALIGTFSPADAGLRLVLAGAGGIIIGIAAGWAIVFARHRIRHFPMVENTLSLLSPFIAYIPAEAVGASGILAVVALGLYLQRREASIIAPATRIQAEAMWTMLTFLLESVIFIAIGLELPHVISGLRTHSILTVIGYAAIVTVVLIIVRFIWVTGSVSLMHYARRGKEGKAAPTWKEGALVAWAGLRGSNSLVIALAIPFVTRTGAPFPARDLILFITFGVIFATLVLQGLTLSRVVTLLHLPVEVTDQSDEAVARVAEAHSALAKLDELVAAGGVSPHLEHRVRERYTARLNRWRAMRNAHGSDSTERQNDARDSWDASASEYTRIRTELLGAERAALATLLDNEKVSDHVLRRLRRELDLETMLLESAEAGGGRGSPYEVTGLIDV